MAHKEAKAKRRILGELPVDGGKALHQHSARDLGRVARRIATGTFCMLQGECSRFRPLTLWPIAIGNI